MYIYQRKVTYSEIASDGRADAAQIVRYFQDCSTLQSESIGRGLGFLSEHKHVWMLTAWQISFDRRPALGEEIVTGTWAYDFDAMYGYRNFILKDNREHILAAANSIWILINMETGRPEKIAPEYVDGYGSEEKYAMHYEPRRILLPTEWEEREHFFVARGDLDTNQHVNNARYISMAMEYLNEGEDIRQLRVEYKKAAVYKDEICPKVHRENDRLIVALCGVSGQVYASIEMMIQ